DYIYAYINYFVNENFIAAAQGKVPAWWTATNGSIAASPGEPYAADLNGFAMNASGTLSTRFTPASGKVSLVWNMLIPSAGAKGFGFSSNSTDFRTPVTFEIDDNGKFVVNGTEIAFSYKNNVWYKIELQIDTETHLTDVYINSVLRKEDVPFISDEADIYSITFENNGSNKIVLDDIAVHKTFDASDFEDYPTIDEKPESELNVGMVIYPMWREGVHYGWDLISPYEERTPYLGYYTGGSREVADWDNKWLLEHGFDHAIFPFARPDITAAGAQPSFSVRGEALHDGYLNSVYKDQLDFAVMLTNPTAEKYVSSADFITNVEPYLVEHYFKNPSYKVINNRLLVYCYNPTGFATNMGGVSQLAAALNSLNEAAKQIDNKDGGKYDGIIFVADVSSGDGVSMFDSLVSNCNFGSYIYKWRYTWGSDKYENIVNGIKTDFSNDNSTVASIPMGFDNIPWKYNEVGIIAPDGVQKMCEAAVNNRDANDPKIVVLTCWDEWGEGHFFAPSNIHGFDYLNAARKTFTTSGEKTDEDRPTEDAIRRMGVLYPEDRQILKIRNDRVSYTSDDLANLTSLGKITVKNSRGSASNCSRSYSLSEGYSYTISGSPATISYSNLSSYGIDASKITAVRIKGYAQNSSTMVLYLTTTTKTNIDEKPLIRLEGKTSGSSTITDTIIFPEEPENFNGTVTGMRFNPTAGTSSGNKIYLQEIEFYTGKMRTTVTVDDEEVDLVSPLEESDTTYIPAYKLLLDLNAYVLWDKNTKTLTAEKTGVTVKLTAGSNKMLVNGTEKTLDYAPYYKEGNLFIPYQGVLEEFGYTTNNDVANRNIAICSKSYEAKKNYVNNYKWEFNIDGYAEDWTIIGVLQPVVVQNGMLQLFAKSADPILTMTDLNIPMSKARYAVLKIKKTDSSEAGMLRLYDDDTSASGVVYRFNLKPSEEVQEIVFDLATDATVSSTYPNTYDSLSNITKIRLDPMDNYGSISIDSIRITDTLVESAYGINAYAFESTNMLQLDTNKTGFAYNNTLNASGTTEGGILPATETVDGYSNVIKVIPASGSSAGLFTLEELYYNGSKQKIANIANDNRIVKVSFWYKGIGNCTQLRFENRLGGARDGEEFQIDDVSNSEWKYFEGYIDLSNESGTGRWFTMRVTTGGNTAQDGVYLRDYKFVCLDETTTVTPTGNDTVAIRMSMESGGVDISDAKVYFAEYGADGKMLTATTKSYPNEVTVLTNGSTKTETAKYYYLNPSDDATEVKCFFWNKFLPLGTQLTITK
ncbi:MAG: glycoside hydrolase family 99-like domain-containing protein, partial [Clostridia bacterium]|nr:glycoside hydrolase family 99-like domain-containing protein [Clostridia bacterium]